MFISVYIPIKGKFYSCDNRHYSSLYILPNQLEYFWLFSLTLLHSLFHRGDDRIRLVLRTVF